MDNQLVLGVDIGGSHITATLVNLKTGYVIKNSQVREVVNSKGTATDIISQWSNIINTAFGQIDLSERKVGIAMPGPFDYIEGIAWMKDQDKYDSLYGLNIKELLADKLKIDKENIRFLNDAESFLSGETFSGAAKGCSRAIGLTLGTGLGSARFTNGTVEDANLWCASFLDSIAEEYLSTRWFVKKYYELTGKKIDGVKELTLLNDENTLEIFGAFGINLGLFLSNVIVKDKPEIIVLGGNISNAYELFKADLHRSLIGLPVIPTIQRSVLGEVACLIGAASCWAEEKEAYENVRA